MRQKSLQFDDFKVAYYESDDKGKPIVFVHGNSLSSAIFVKQFIDPVIVENYRVIAIDLPGCGDSERSKKPQEDYLVEGLSKILVDFCVNLGITDAVFAGHSLGGNILLNCFDKLPNPKGLVLLGSPPAKKPMDMSMYLQHPAIPLFFKEELDDGDIFHLSSALFEPETRYPEFIPEIIRKSDPLLRKFILESIEKANYRDQIDILQDISVPVAVFHGQKGQLVNFEYMRNLEFPTMWNQSIEIIRDGGHMFFYENPADFNAVLLGYLDMVM